MRLFHLLHHFSLLAVNHCHLLSLIVICCHLLCHFLSFAVIHCHLLSLVVIRCTTRYHSLSLAVIRCHLLYDSLSLVVPLVCLFIDGVSATDPAFAHLTYLFFFYLLVGTVKDHVKYQRQTFAATKSG